MSKAKIILAGSAEIVQTVKKQLEKTLFTVIAGISSGNEVLRRMTTLYPDIVIADYRLADMTGVDLARMIEYSKICPVIVLADHGQSEYVEDLKKISLDIFCITKPLNNLTFNKTVSLVLRFTKKNYEYFDYASKNLPEDNDIIEKAKKILMKELNTDADSAYKKILKKAGDSSRTLSYISKTIIDMNKLAKE